LVETQPVSELRADQARYLGLILYREAGVVCVMSGVRGNDMAAADGVACGLQASDHGVA